MRTFHSHYFCTILYKNQVMSKAMCSTVPNGSKMESFKLSITFTHTYVNFQTSVVQFSGHVDAGKSTLMGHLLYSLGDVTKRSMHKYPFEKITKFNFGKAIIIGICDW